MNNLKEYLKKEWRYCNHAKYQHYFEDWFSNITQSQRLYMDIEDCLPVADGEGVAVPCELIDGE